MTVRKFTVPIFCQTFMVVHGGSAQEGAKVIGKFLKTEIVDYENSHGFTISDGSKVGVWLAEDSKENTYVHESYHVAKRMMEHIGDNMGAVGEETFAYLLGWVFEQIVKAKPATTTEANP